MVFSLADLNQDEEQDCPIHLEIGDHKVSPIVTLRSSLSKTGVDARSKYSEGVRRIIDGNNATDKALLDLEVDYALELLVGWPKGSEAFFLCEATEENMDEIMRSPAYGIVRKAIIEASTVSENFTFKASSRS